MERFRREARAVAQLNHPHVVQVIDAGDVLDAAHPTPYIVFEYVEGETLKDRIRRLGRLPVDEAIAYAQAAGQPLAVVGLGDPSDDGIDEAVLQQLADETGQSCNLSVLDAGRVRVIAQVESPADFGFRVRVGALFPVGTATGSVLIAGAPADAPQLRPRAGVDDERRAGRRAGSSSTESGPCAGARWRPRACSAARASPASSRGRAPESAAARPRAGQDPLTPLPAAA